MDFSPVILSLKVHVAEGVDNEDLAILSNNSLSSTGRTTSRSRGSSSGRSLRLGTARLLNGLSTISLGKLLLHTALSSVLGHGGSFLLVAGGRGSGFGDRSRSIDAGDVETIAPGCLPGKLDVALNKLGLALPAHVEGEVVEATADNDKQADNDRAQAGTVSVVVVIGALPEREAIGEEMVVSVALGATKDVGDEGETGLGLAGLLDSGLDLGIGRRLCVCAVLLVLLGLRSHSLPDLVGVQVAGLLAVRLCDIVQRSRGGHAEDVVEVGGLVGLVLCDFISNAEDFAI